MRAQIRQDLVRTPVQQHRVVTGLLFGAAVLCFLLLIPVARSVNADAVAQAVAFEQVTGAKLDADFLSQPERLYVWWMEWTVDNVALTAWEKINPDHDEFRPLFSARGRAIVDSLSPPKDEAERAARTEARAKQDREEQELLKSVFHAPSATDVTYRYARRIPDVPGKSALVGYLPPELYTSIPAAGRLENPAGVGEFRLVVDWEGKPLPPAQIESIVQSFDREQEMIDSLGPIFVDARAPDAAEKLMARRLGLIPGAITNDLLEMVRSGELPLPAPLSDQDHRRVRLLAPGNLALCEFRAIPFGDNYWPLMAYAAHLGTELNGAVSSVQRIQHQAIHDDEWLSPMTYVFSSPTAVGLTFVGGFFGMVGIWRTIKRYLLGAAENPTARPNDPRELGAPSSFAISNPTQAFNHSPLSAKDPREIRTVLESRGPVGRAIRHRIDMNVTAKTIEQTQAGTREVEAQGEYLATILRKQTDIQELHNKLGRLQDEGSLRGLQLKKQIAELETDIAKLEHEQRRLNERPAPQALNYEEAVRKRWKAKRDKGLAVADAYDEAKAEGEQKYRDNPEALRNYLDVLQNWYDEELQK